MRRLKNKEMRGFVGKYQSWLPIKQWIKKMQKLEQMKNNFPEPAWEAVKGE